MYLDNDLTVSNIELIDRIPGIFGIKDSLGNYKAINQLCSEVYGFEKGTRFIEDGGTDDDIRAPIAEIANTLRSEDKIALRQKKPVKILTKGLFAGGEVLYFYGEKFCIDESHVAFHQVNLTELKNINVLNVHKLFNLIKKQFPENKNNQGSICIDSCYHDIGLTERQSEILYLFILGKTMREIGEFLMISKRTAEYHIDNIKRKFNCHNKGELITYALENNLMSRIPETIFEKFS